MHLLAHTWLRRAALIAPAICLCFLIASCDDFFVSERSIQSVKATPPAIILMAAPTAGTNGDTFTLTSTATTVGGTQTNDTATATWSSSDSSIVTAAAGGVVTAVTTTGGQSADVTAKDGGVTSNKVKVFVYTGSVPTSINLTGTSGTVSPGSYQLKITLGSGGQDVTNFVEWTSSNTSVATVSSTGVVTVLTSATAGATATITATAHLGAPSGTTPPGPITSTATFTAT